MFNWLLVCIPCIALDFRSILLCHKNLFSISRLIELYYILLYNSLSKSSITVLVATGVFLVSLASICCAKHKLVRHAAAAIACFEDADTLSIHSIKSFAAS